MSVFRVGVDPMPAELSKKILTAEPGYRDIVRIFCEYVNRDRGFAMAARCLYEEACKTLNPTTEEKIEAEAKLFAVIEAERNAVEDDKKFRAAAEGVAQDGEERSFTTSSGVAVVLRRT